MRVGLLTGGGDCPGLNAVIRAVVRKGETVYGDELVGFEDGWRGVIENRTMPLDVHAMRGTLPRGGTILGTSRTNPYKVDGGVEAVKATLAAQQIDALVAIGGEDTLGVANKLDGEGLSIVGVPKTIDNDLSATEVTFGFHTAVQIASDAIDRLHTTAESHDRVMVCEVMGRHAGGSPRTPASPPGPAPSSSPRSRSTSRTCARSSGTVTNRVGTRRSSWSPKGPCRRRAR